MTPSRARYSICLCFVAAILLVFLDVSAEAQNSGQTPPTAKVFSAYAQSHELVAKYRPPVRTRSAAGIAVYNAASPGVVFIVVGDVQGNDLTNVSLGSGVIIDSAGYVLTNWHVIAGHRYAGVVLKPSTPAELSDPRTYIGEVISKLSGRFGSDQASKTSRGPKGDPARKYIGRADRRDYQCHWASRRRRALVLHYWRNQPNQ